MHGLGELESAIMDVVWAAEGAVAVRDVLESLRPDRALAYTTVQTVLDKLCRKGWLTREKHGRAFRYLATATRAQRTARLLREVLDESPDSAAVLLHFAQSVSAEESAALRDVLGEDGRRR
ncbi:BlaI/MecI/CopY family transcriptional regulator [Crossiella cryophila]|uniref:Putative transcriptional regulator n=1 Tax=Crossiella cryophila TaxID=43355 RepID=A0A7W7FTM9_9PSEU|nr:BlaI/MecI/CopY family transcriptional regulator [Crossiella cryophila]MBB4678351.1 putative transcriptional regulator [Crossiella cryophila]